jgi:hypothetical protein
MVARLAEDRRCLPTLAEVSRSRGTGRRVWGRRWAGMSAPWPRLSPSKHLRRRHGNLRRRLGSVAGEKSGVRGINSKATHGPSDRRVRPR